MTDNEKKRILTAVLGLDANASLAEIANSVSIDKYTFDEAGIKLLLSEIPNESIGFLKSLSVVSPTRMDDYPLLEGDEGMRAWYRGAIDHKAHHPNVEIDAVLHDNKIVGFFSRQWNLLSYIHAHLNYRHSKLGTLLYLRALRQIKEDGFHTMPIPGFKDDKKGERMHENLTRYFRK